MGKGEASGPPRLHFPGVSVSGAPEGALLGAQASCATASSCHFAPPSLPLFTYGETITKHSLLRSELGNMSVTSPRPCPNDPTLRAPSPCTLQGAVSAFWGGERSFLGLPCSPLALPSLSLLPLPPVVLHAFLRAWDNSSVRLNN